MNKAQYPETVSLPITYSLIQNSTLCITFIINIVCVDVNVLDRYLVKTDFMSEVIKSP